MEWMDAFERRRHFTGETTVEALEAYLRVKACIGGTLSLLTGPEVGTGARLTAPRPLISTLDLSKIETIGFTPADSMRRLEEYVSALLSETDGND